jgi:hypothetical protein
MSVDHWMTFGKFAEQEFFRYPNTNTYAGVIINANMLSHAPAGLAAFISGKTRPQFPYIIDPLTHAFQHNPSALKNDGGEIKSSIQNLIGEYGKLIQMYAGQRALIPKYFENQELINDFVQNCLKFQSEKLHRAILDSENFKYMEQSEINKPYALIAPYFFMDEVTIHEWIDINIQLINTAIELSTDYKLFGALVISQGILLENDLINEIIEKFSSLEVSGYLLWIDELDETISNRSTLKGLIDLTTGLRKKNSKELINLHGGYFSVLSSAPKLKSPLFTGITHGPEYGEHRKILPVGGGIPVSKFYIKLLHNRINYKDAARFFSKKGWLSSSQSYYENICSCESCHRVIGSNAGNFTKYGESVTKKVQRGSNMVSMEYPLQETKERCLRHYLCKKDEEYNFAKKADKSSLLTDLQEGIDVYQTIMSPAELRYLYLWKELLNIL